MRQEIDSQEACRLAIKRIIHKQPKYKKVDHCRVGFIALQREGCIGAMSYREGFQYCLNTDGTHRVFDAADYVK